MNKKLKVLAATSLTALLVSQCILPANAYGIYPDLTATDTVETAAKELETITIGKNILTNPNFDNGFDGWEYDKAGGNVYVASNNPGPSRGKHYGMDPAANGPSIKQKVTIPATDKYYLSHNVATTSKESKLQVLRGDDVLAETAFTSNDGKYHRYTIEFEADKGDEIIVRVVAQENKERLYVNGDDFYLGTSKDGQETVIEKPTFDETGNLIANGDFTDGLKYWASKNVNHASNNPPKFDGIKNDKNIWGVDPKDTYLKRYIEIPQDGDYIFSHWVAATGSKGIFGIKYLNGDVIEEQKIKGDGKYHKEVIRFSAEKGDRIEIYVLPDRNSGWTNGDYFYLGLDNSNLVSNPGFEAVDAATGWQGANIKTDRPFSGKNYTLVETGNLLSKKVSLDKSGYYDFGVFVNNVTSDDAKIQFIKGNEVIKEVSIPKTDTYKRIYLNDIELTKGEYTIKFTDSKAGGYAVDEMELVLNQEEDIFANIVEFETAGRVVEQSIDKYNGKVNLTFIYGDDLSAIEVKNLKLSEGVTASIKEGDKLDLTKPLDVTLTTSDGKTKVWTIDAKWHHRKISMSSSNKQVENFFNWAVNKLDKFVVTGQTGKVDDGKKPDAEYIPSYWAGYFNRTAFYGRDFVHQATGGQIGGLADENFSMFKTFAKGATESRKWYTPWAFNFDGSIYYLDYSNDDWFVREIPAQFELVEKVWEQYLWSGDERYITDPDILRFCEKTVTDFVELHDDQNPNGVAEGKGHLFIGTATYNERHNDFMVDGDPTIEAADGIACQYAAYVAYANILEARGEDATKVKEWRDKAAELKRYFNEEWSVYKADPTEDEFVVELSKNGRQRIGFAMETNYFIPLKELVEPGPRNDAALDLIIEGLGDGAGDKTDGAPDNIESYTYIPEMLYKYNRVEQAWDWMQYIDSIKDDKHEMAHQGLNGDYPEVSFTAISNVVEGMMGVDPNASKNLIATSPRLSEEIPDATVKYMDIGGQLVHLTHIGNTESQITNASDEDFTWEARFYGEYDYINIDGKTVEAKQKEINGETVSYATVTVKPDATVDAKATNEAIYNVKIDTVENGTVFVDKTSAVKGETVKITAIPDNGYVLDTIKINGEAIEGETFTMPEKDVTITAVFKKETEPTPEINKDVLNALIIHAESLNKAEYTVETWVKCQEALDTAKKVSADKKATQDQVDKVTQVLKAAIEDLVKITVTPEKPDDKPNEDKTNSSINTGDNTKVASAIITTAVAGVAVVIFSKKRKEE